MTYNEKLQLEAKKIIYIEDSSSIRENCEIKDFADFQELVQDSVVFVKKTYCAIEDYIRLCDFYSQMRSPEEIEFEEYLNWETNYGEQIENIRVYTFFSYFQDIVISFKCTAISEEENQKLVAKIEQIYKKWIKATEKEHSLLEQEKEQNKTKIFSKYLKEYKSANTKTDKQNALSKLALEYEEYAKNYDERYIGRITRQKAEILLSRFAESIGESICDDAPEENN